jgi:hypothetical protein
LREEALFRSINVSSQYLGESQNLGLPNWGGRIIWGNLPQIIERIRINCIKNPAVFPGRQPLVDVKRMCLCRADVDFDDALNAF